MANEDLLLHRVGRLERDKRKLKNLVKQQHVFIEALLSQFGLKMNAVFVKGSETCHCQKVFNLNGTRKSRLSRRSMTSSSHHDATLMGLSPESLVHLVNNHVICDQLNRGSSVETDDEIPSTSSNNPLCSTTRTTSITVPKEVVLLFHEQYKKSQTTNNNKGGKKPPSRISVNTQSLNNNIADSSDDTDSEHQLPGFSANTRVRSLSGDDESNEEHPFIDDNSDNEIHPLLRNGRRGSKNIFGRRNMTHYSKFSKRSEINKNCKIAKESRILKQSSFDRTNEAKNSGKIKFSCAPEVKELIAHQTISSQKKYMQNISPFDFKSNPQCRNSHASSKGNRNNATSQGISKSLKRKYKDTLSLDTPNCKRQKKLSKVNISSSTVTKSKSRKKYNEATDISPASTRSKRSRSRKTLYQILKENSVRTYKTSEIPHNLLVLPSVVITNVFTDSKLKTNPYVRNLKKKLSLDSGENSDSELSEGSQDSESSRHDFENAGTASDKESCNTSSAEETFQPEPQTSPYSHVLDDENVNTPVAHSVPAFNETNLNIETENVSGASSSGIFTTDSETVDYSLNMTKSDDQPNRDFQSDPYARRGPRTPPGNGPPSSDDVPQSEAASQFPPVSAGITVVESECEVSEESECKVSEDEGSEDEED